MYKRPKEYILPASPETRLTPDIPQTEDFDFAEALESVYPLLQLVFEYLPFIDLKSAAKVKKSWESTTEAILNQRNELSWLSVFKERRFMHFFNSSGYEFSNKSIGLIFFNYYAISLNDKFRDRFNETFRLKDFFAKKIVPEGVKYCILSCPGIDTLSPQGVRDLPKNKTPLFNVFFLPDIPDVEISMSYFNFSKTEKPVPPKDLDRVKCLLLFCKSDLKDNLYTILESFVRPLEANGTALGGGIIRNSWMLPEDSQATKRRAKSLETHLCVAFRTKCTVDSQFDAFSVVITGAELTNEVFKSHLSKFKDNITLRSHCICLRICCAAKPKKKFETRVFSEVFGSGIPLVSLEVDGEIGWDSYPNNNDSICEMPVKKKSKKWYPAVQHQWSTIFVLLTWGKVLK